MKTTPKAFEQNRPYSSYNYPMYPNAADNGYFTKKATDILAAILSGMGIMTAMMFLVILA